MGTYAKGVLHESYYIGLVMNDECFLFLLVYEGLPTFHQKSWQILLSLKENFVYLQRVIEQMTQDIGSYVTESPPRR